MAPISQAAQDVDWPGLGAEYKDGFEVNYGRLKEIGRSLVAEFDKVYGRLHKPFRSGAGMKPGKDWQAAKTAAVLISDFEEALSCFTGDTMMDCMAAGGLVASCGQTYEFVEDQKEAWRKMPPLFSHLPERSWSPKGHYRVSNAYPGPEMIFLTGPYGDALPLKAEDPIQYDIQDDHSHYGKSWGEIHDMLMSWKSESLSDYAKATKAISDDMHDIARQLLLHGQEIRDAPWRGPAADKAQLALKKIYDNVRNLADVHGKVADHTSECARMLAEAQHCFKGANFGDLWGTLWGIEDPEAVAFLTRFDGDLGNQMRSFPQEAESALPGLIPENDRDVYSLAW